MTLYEGKYRIESTRLKRWNYSSRGWYFVTICTHNRRLIFGRIVNHEVHLSPLGVIADAELKSLNTHYKNVELTDYIVMPNHVHAIVMIDGEHCFPPHEKRVFCNDSPKSFTSPSAGSLSAIVRSYKAGVTLEASDLGFRQAIWQARFHDHLLRGDKVIAAVREYRRNNPANWAIDKENRS